MSQDLTDKETIKKLFDKLGINKIEQLNRDEIERQKAKNKAKRIRKERKK